MSQFDKYKEFVDEVTSKESKNYYDFGQRLAILNNEGVPIERLLTGAVGINAEGGEFMEIVKKVIFQGKPYTEENVRHLKVELGDIMWYVAQCAIALDISMEELLDMNIEKLSKRYPDGTFDAYYSENRKEGDI